MMNTLVSQEEVLELSVPMAAADDAVPVALESSWIVSQGSLDSCVSVVFLDPLTREPILPSSPRPSQRLVLIPPSDSPPCEITVIFQKRLCHIENFYILSTARICELYSRSKLTADPEYICTVKGWLPDDPQSPSENPEIENTVFLHPTKLNAALNESMILSTENHCDNIEDSTGEDYWVDVKPNGSSNADDRSRTEVESVSDHQHTDSNNYELCKIENEYKHELDSYGEKNSSRIYEAELELLDHSPWEALTVRLLSLQFQTRVEIDQVVFLAVSGPAISEPMLPDPLAPRGKNSELLTMFIPSMLQMAQRYTNARISEDSLKSSGNRGLIMSGNSIESPKTAVEFNLRLQSNNDGQNTQVEQSKCKEEENQCNEVKLSDFSVNNVQHESGSLATDNLSSSLSRNVLVTLQAFSARFDRIESLCLHIDSYLQQAVERIDQRVTILEESHKEILKRMPGLHSSPAEEMQGHLSPKTSFGRPICNDVCSTMSAAHGLASVATGMFGQPSAATTMDGDHEESEEPCSLKTYFGTPICKDVCSSKSAAHGLTSGSAEMCGQPSEGTPMDGDHKETEEPLSASVESDTFCGNDCDNDSRSQIIENYAGEGSFPDSGSAISVQCDPHKKLHDAWMTSLSAFTSSYSRENSNSLDQSIGTGNISFSRPEDYEMQNVESVYIDYTIVPKSACITSGNGSSIMSGENFCSPASGDSEKLKQSLACALISCEDNLHEAAESRSAFSDQPSEVVGLTFTRNRDPVAAGVDLNFKLFDESISPSIKNQVDVHGSPSSADSEKLRQCLDCALISCEDNLDEAAESRSAFSDQPSEVVGLTFTRNRDPVAADVDLNFKLFDESISPSISNRVEVYGSSTGICEADTTSCFQTGNSSPKTNPSGCMKIEQNLQIIDNYLVDMGDAKIVSCKAEDHDAIHISAKQNEESTIKSNESDIGLEACIRFSI